MDSAQHAAYHRCNRMRPRFGCRSHQFCYLLCAFFLLNCLYTHIYIYIYIERERQHQMATSRCGTFSVAPLSYFSWCLFCYLFLVTAFFRIFLWHLFLMAFLLPFLGRLSCDLVCYRSLLPLLQQFLAPFFAVFSCWFFLGTRFLLHFPSTFPSLPFSIPFSIPFLLYIYFFSAPPSSGAYFVTFS